MIKTLATKQETLKETIHRCLDDIKATDIVDIDVREFPTVTDLLIICSGRSSRHVQAICDKVVEYSKQVGSPPLGCEGQENAEWIIVDLGDVVVHIMRPDVRQFYDLEGLWQHHDDATQTA